MLTNGPIAKHDLENSDERANNIRICGTPQVGEIIHSGC